MPTKILIQQAEDIKLNDGNEVDEILGNPPNWILRWGITLTFTATLLFGVIAWLIKYPDVISAPVQILTENPAIRVVALASGQLEQLYVTNQETVKRNQLLAVIENSTNLETVIEVEKFLEIAKNTRSSSAYLKLNPNETLILGTMKETYMNLVQQLKKHQDNIKRTIEVKKIKLLTGQVEYTKSLNQTLIRQQNIFSKEVTIIAENLKRNRTLHEEKVISDILLEKSETTFLQYQRQEEDYEAQIINNAVQIQQLQAQILDLEQIRTDDLTQGKLMIQEHINNLFSQIADWKKTYIIRAPIDGKVNLTDIWSLNQFVKAGSELLTIVPLEGTGKMIGRAKLPLANSGKVKKGQSVNLRLEGFPYQEFGNVKAEVGAISLLPEENYYLLAIDLPNNLRTTYDKDIPFSQEMIGTANIITTDRRILERILDRFFNLIKNT